MQSTDGEIGNIIPDTAKVIGFWCLSSCFCKPVLK